MMNYIRKYQGWKEYIEKSKRIINITNEAKDEMNQLKSSRLVHYFFRN
ncbi:MULTISPECIES: hypothetical protein [Clostridium]|nr:MULTISPECIES: hypothetical protein [Clostridium]